MISNYKVYTYHFNIHKVITQLFCNYKVCTLLIISYIVITSSAQALTFKSPLMDGTLVYGYLDKGETLYINQNYLNIGKDKEKLYQIHSDSNGQFVIGIPQDLNELKLTLNSNGNTQELSYPITQNHWQEEVVTGLQPDRVQPNPQNAARISREASEIRFARQNTTFNSLPTSWVKPIQEKHRISSFFGSRRVLNGVKKQGHSGVDYAAPIHTPIHVPAAGRVVYVNSDVFLTGKTIMIDHGYGLFSSYSHLNKINVKLNQIVNQNDILGEVGTTGRSSGPHLHFTITWFGVRVDPECLFKSYTIKKQNI